MKALIMSLRQKLLSAASAVTLALTSLTGVALAQPDSAQQSQAISDVASPATPNNLTSAVAAEAFDTAAKRRTIVNFKHYKNLNELYELAPQAREVIEKFGPKSALALVEKSGDVANISDSLLLFRFNSPENCGSLGCSHTAFVIDANGASIGLDVVIPGPIEISGDAGQESLFLCTDQAEWVEWRRQGTTTEFAPVPLPVGQKNSSCNPG